MLSRPFRKLIVLSSAILMMLHCFSAHAQVYPVQVTPQLVPPYSVYLSDYATGGNEKLRVILLQRDLSRPSYQVRLVMNVEWNGRVIMRTSRSFNPAPLNLDPGIPMVISGADLAPYLDSRNIDFVGYDRNQYERTRALPEGQYRISFIAYDYRRQDVQVSPEGNSFLYLAKSEPPLINYPACGTKLPMREPQQIIFSWMPRNTSSPNSALETEYEFSLYETRPTGRNPNDVVLTSQPVFRTRTNLTQLIYGPAEPLLLRDITYVWRVQAIDLNGRDAFRNSGYSEVCTFYYGGSDANFDIGVVKDLDAIGETKNRGKISWTTGYYDAYRVEYKKTGSGYEWFRTDTQTGQLKIFDLEPDTEYEARVQAKKSGYFGPYSEIVKFRTLPNRAEQCGENPNLPDLNNPGAPLTSALTGMVINARGSEMTLLQVTQLDQPGWYKGYGHISFDYFLGLAYGVTFDKIYINENREVVFGRIDIMSEGMEEIIKKQVEASRKIITSTSSDPRWQETDFHESVFEYNDIVITDVFADVNGNIVIIDDKGKSQVNTDIKPILVDVPGKAVIIEDKNGDQYVVEKKDGKVSVTKVVGGGLPPASNSTVASTPVKDAIIVLILEQFEIEIEKWLELNGKGGDDDEDIYSASQMPEAFPKEANFLKHLNAEVISHFKTHPEELRVHVERSNKETLDNASGLFKSNDEIDWNKIKVEDQDILRNVTANSVMALAGGEINESEITDLVPECGRTHAGKEKPWGSLYLISYPKECSGITENMATTYVTQGYAKFLCAQERFDLIKCLADGIVWGPQEDAIIQLITDTPKAHTASLLSLFNSDNTGVLSNINSGFQFGNYVTAFKAIRQLYLSGTSQAVIDSEIKELDKTYFSLTTRQEKAKQNCFTWFEGGLLKGMFSDDFVFNRFDDVEISENGTVTFRFANDPGQTGETTVPISIKPFALVGIRIRGNSNEVLEAGNGNMVYVPGIMLPLLFNKKEAAKFFDALNATAVLSGVGSIVTGATRFAIVSGGIDVLLGGSALVVDSYKDDILKMQGGEAFLEAYVMVNKAFLVYFGTKTILQLGQALPKLVTAATAFKNSDDFAKLKATNPSKAAAIEREVDDVVTKGGKLTEHLSKIWRSADEMRADVITWAKSYREGIKSTTQIPKFNKACAASYKKADGTIETVFGRNGGVLRSDKGYPTISAEKELGLHEELAKRLPEKTNWPNIANCAECDAVNQALHNGAKWEDIQIHTIDIKLDGTMIDRIRCDECQDIFKGMHVTSE